MDQEHSVDDSEVPILMMTVVLALFLFGTTSGPCALPEGISTLLSTKLAGWRPADVGDLDEEDQNIWRSRWGQVCPFMAEGKVLSRTRNDLSVVLIHGDGDQRRQRVVVVRRTMPALIVSALPATPAPRISVLRTLSPGRYADVDGRQVEVAFSPIVLETIEAGSLLLYWDRGSFRSILLSQ